MSHLEENEEPKGIGPRKIAIERMRRVGTLAALVASMPNDDLRYALFLGAGASISSGIPAAGTLVSRWKRRVYCDINKKPFWHPGDQTDFENWCKNAKNGYEIWKRKWEERYGRQPSDYALLFNYAFPAVDARQGFIERLISAAEPGPGYIYLASLAAAGYFKTFLTTNFDDLIHDALFRYAGLKPAVSAFDSQVASMRLQGPRPKIIKLHGDFLFNNIRNVGSEVAYLDQNMQEKFERTCEAYGLIVIGYGGQDQSVMAPLRSMVHRRDRLTHGLHWCVTEEKRKNEDGHDEGTGFAWVPEELARMWDAYPEKVHLYVIDSFDEVMEVFYKTCGCKFPGELARPEEKALYVRLRDGLANADQTWRLRPHFQSVMRMFREASAAPPSKSALLLDQADEHHSNGTRHLRNKANYADAKACYEKACELATMVLMMGTTSPLHKVHAYRRRSGTSDSLVEVFLKENFATTTIILGTTDLERVNKGTKSAIRDVRAGMALDRRLGAPPELRGHRLNLAFNGLLSYGLRLHAGIKLTDKERDEALNWLDRMTASISHGDEYVKLVSEELGGRMLLWELEKWANDKRQGSVVEDLEIDEDPPPSSQGAPVPAYDA